MGTQHTPGHWHYSEPQAPHYDFNPICPEGSQEYIATAVFTGNAEETAANARLIAAAPDLLAALKLIADMESSARPDFMSSIEAINAECKASSMRDHARMQAIARDAIARAEGKAQS